MHPQAHGGARVEEVMTEPLLASYFPVLVFLGIAAGIAIAMVAGAMLAARQKPYAEKLSTYECGYLMKQITPESIRWAITFYQKHPDLLATHQRNSKKAAETEHWDQEKIALEAILQTL